MIKIFKDLIQTVGLPITSFTVSRDMKKKLKIFKKNKKIKSSENDQITGHFQSYFIYFFCPPPPPPDPKSEKIPVSQLIKKFLAQMF